MVNFTEGSEKQLWKKKKRKAVVVSHKNYSHKTLFQNLVLNLKSFCLKVHH